jgi:hypothetical protein
MFQLGKSTEKYSRCVEVLRGWGKYGTKFKIIVDIH